jgi:hypothetical protein
MRADDFTKKVKDTLARRVAFRCSNPECRMPTSGPNEEPRKSTNIGVAAHICAASKNGPRYDPNQSSDERKYIGNGIWLCDTCSVLIDRDPGKYPIKQLIEWKDIAEKQAGAELNKQLSAGNYSDFSVGDGSEYELKWGRSALVLYDTNGKLAHAEFRKGGSVSHKEKRLYIQAQDFTS